MSATPQQQAVIDASSGVILVKACPGSGKTTTLVNRCRALSPKETKKVLMFNKNAQLDFVRKLGAASLCDISTFHSYCSQEIWNAPENYGFDRSATPIRKASEGGLGIFAQFKVANHIE